jgi:hypothetical protein
MPNGNSDRYPHGTTVSWEAGNGIDARSVSYRLIELEAENLRLQRLVAELLIKNQQLRDMYCGDTDSSEGIHHPPGLSA